MHGSVPVHRSGAAVDDLRLSGAVGEKLAELTDQDILAVEVEVADDAHPGQVLHAAERPATLATQLLQDRPGVLHAGAGRQAECIPNAGNAALQLFRSFEQDP